MVTEHQANADRWRIRVARAREGDQGPQVIVETTPPSLELNGRYFILIEEIAHPATIRHTTT